MERYSSARLLRGQVVVGRSLFHHRMKLLDKIGREFSGDNILESGNRLLHRKPLSCSLYVLSLSCGYCSEYDKFSDPLPAEVLEKRF